MKKQMMMIGRNSAELKTVYMYSFTTIFILAFIVILLVGCMFYIYVDKNKDKNHPHLHSQSTVVVATDEQRINNPYSPPLKNDGTFFPTNRQINIQTHGVDSNFTQIGILTKHWVSEPKILPLMGRRIMNGRNKFQYYTISNTGAINTKLPIRKDGRNSMDEYGCDELYNGDLVFVEGYDDQFKTTIYENSTFRYIP
jgi:hypothetical protein